MAIIWKEFKVELVGTSPILMHNGKLADSAYSWTKLIKELTDKPSKKRTPDDDGMKREFEWNGSLYHDDVIGPYLPPEIIEGCIRDGAKKVKSGLANSVVSGVGVKEDKIKLIYDGPRDRDSLYKDARFVDSRIVKLKQSASLLRTRPMFAGWSVEFTLNLIPEVIGASQVKTALEKAGVLVGLCDYRPKFGRFMVKRFDLID